MVHSVNHEPWFTMVHHATAPGRLGVLQSFVGPGQNPRGAQGRGRGSLCNPVLRGIQGIPGIIDIRGIREIPDIPKGPAYGNNPTGLTADEIAARKKMTNGNELPKESNV